MAMGDVLAFVNNDCWVTPGWDTALVACARAGHLAFPHTDEGAGPRMSEGNVCGWCFAMTPETFAKVGPFDETFVPAQYEDTDFFHRAHALGIPLTPVPAAVVQHTRWTTTGRAWPEARHNWLHLANRYRYGWKHNVDPGEVPAFYGRAVTPWGG
jgi:GT2 family glycosyltransferase